MRGSCPLCHSNFGFEDGMFESHLSNQHGIERNAASIFVNLINRVDKLEKNAKS